MSVFKYMVLGLALSFGCSGELDDPGEGIAGGGDQSIDTGSGSSDQPGADSAGADQPSAPAGDGTVAIDLPDSTDDGCEAADLNGNGAVDLVDLGNVVELEQTTLGCIGHDYAPGLECAALDFDDDHGVSLADLSVLLQERALIDSCLAGETVGLACVQVDYNANGAVDLVDLGTYANKQATLLGCMGVDFSGDVACSAVDFNRNGAVDLVDLSEVAGFLALVESCIGQGL